MKRHLFFLALLAAMLPLAEPAADSTFRCGGGIVSLGDKRVEVAQRCGEPDGFEQWEEGDGRYYFEYYDYKHERYMLPRRIIGPLRMERWTYDLGSNRFIRYLYFRNDELIRIETGGWGKN